MLQAAPETESMDHFYRAVIVQAKNVIRLLHVVKMGIPGPSTLFNTKPTTIPAGLRKTTGKITQQNDAIA